MEIPEVLEILRTTPGSFSELPEEAIACLRSNLLPSEVGFTEQQRELLKGWFLIVPPEHEQSIAAFNELSPIKLGICTLQSGDRAIPASILTDAENYPRNVLPIDHWLLVEGTVQEPEVFNPIEVTE